MERDAIQAKETNDGPRNLFSQEAGNVPLLTVYSVCSTWRRFARWPRLSCSVHRAGITHTTHEPIPSAQAMKILDAPAAVDK